MLAYIDPGAGSLLIQGLIASLLAIPFFFRSSLSRGIDRLRSLRRSPAPDRDERADA